MKIKYLLSFILYLSPLLWKEGGGDAFSQNQIIDSLLILLKTDKPDTNKVNHLNKLSREYLSIGEYERGVKHGNEALELASSISIGNRKGWPTGIAIAHNNIGTIFYFQGNYPETLKSYYAALKIWEDIGNKKGIAQSYNNIGIIYRNQGNYSEALKNLFAALKIRKDIKDKQGIADTYNNIGNVYWNQGNYPEALKNYFISLEIKEEINNKQGTADTYNNIGVIYTAQGNYHEALKNYFASLKIRENIGDKSGITTSFTNLSAVQIKLNNLKEAQDYLNRALQIAKEIGYKESIVDSYNNLVIIDSIQGNWKQAYEHHKLFITYRDSIYNEETRKKITETTMTYEFEKKEAAIKTEQDKKDLIAAADKKRQQYILTLVLCALLLVFIFSGFIFRSLRVTRKQKLIIEEKSKLVEEKNKGITDSINYAKRIQDALLQEEEHISKHLPEHFILFKPKDIVSGDFYWSYEQMAGNESKMEKTSYWYLAAADCTGHGVPGAFMSMLGMAFLNEIAATNQLVTPSGILDKLRGRIVKELGQSSQTSQSKDGMDISMVRIELPFPNGEGEGVRLQWAGANNPIYIVHKSPLSFEEGKPALSGAEGRLEEIKPNKQPIGYHPEMQPFINHTIKLEKGSVFYLFTDGYADQFGGEKGKKFMYNKFKELLLSIHDKPMQEQKEILNSTFESWKEKVEQVDDVCVIGVRV